jgi:hypothetical protein
MEMEEKIKYVMENTEILMFPKKFLSTYDTTTVHYYLLTSPFYIEFEGKNKDAETVIREGRITWQKPRLITPYYILRTEGFSEEAKKAFQMIAVENLDIAMMLYKLKLVKDYEHIDIVSNSLEEVRKRIESDVEKSSDPFCAIIKGVDEFWDVSLTKFIYALMADSAYFAQIPEFSRKNYINLDPGGLPVVSRDDYGIPLAAKNEIEILFSLYMKGEIDIKKLKEEIDNWGLFEYYQDRFFNLFKKTR